MPTSDEILLNELLMEREEHFGVVYDIEQEVESILGLDIDFDIPLQLPSLQKRKKKPKAKPQPQKAALRVRKLNDSESAYLVKYRSGTEILDETHIDPQPLEILLNTPPKSVKILTIQTIDSNENPLESLYSREY